MRLAADLKAKGANVWLDQLDIKPGGKWAREIERALASCNEMMVILSPLAVDSDNVMNEVAFALDESKRVIPIVYCDCKLPLLLRGRQYVDLRTDYKRGLIALLTTLGVEQSASAAFAAPEERPIAVSRTEPEPHAAPAESEEGNRPAGTNVAEAEDSPSGWWRARYRGILQRWPLVATGTMLLLGGTIGIVQWLGTHNGSQATRQESSPLPQQAGETKTNPDGSWHAPTTTTAPTVLSPHSDERNTSGKEPHNKVQVSASRPRAPHPGETTINAKVGLTYVWIPPGDFTMGCSPGDSECSNDEKPPHHVTLTKGFWMGQTTVTQEAYKQVVGSDPSYFKGPQLPVEQVNWNEAVSHCRAVGMRLPTEAEWEFAARAGSQASRYGALDTIAWYLDNSGYQTHEVRQKQPNAWGLYDMLGNVWQWTADWYSEKYYSPAALTDTRGPASGTSRVLRRGDWLDYPRSLRVSCRDSYPADVRSNFVGFRCVWE